MGVKWQLTYRCRLCETVYITGGTDDDMNSMMMGTSLVTGNQVHRGIPVGILARHSCDDGSYGVADVLGIVKNPGYEDDQS